MNQILNYKNLSIFKKLFGEYELQFSILEDAVNKLRGENSSNQQTKSVNPQNVNSIEPNRIERNQIASNLIVPDSDEPNLIVPSSVESNLIVPDSAEPNLIVPSSVETNEIVLNSAKPAKVRKYCHLEDIDSLVESIDNRMTDREADLRIKRFLNSVLQTNGLENFLSEKIMLNTIFAVVVSHHSFLREQDKSGYVSKFYCNEILKLFLFNFSFLITGRSKREDL